jgi:hypothetical protein
MTSTKFKSCGRSLDGHNAQVATFHAFLSCDTPAEYDDAIFSSEIGHRHPIMFMSSHM